MSTNTARPEKLKNVVVIGAGVVGLTTAVKIQEKGRYRVTIIAETLPSDPKTIRYTSQWAGAHHVSIAELEDIRQHNFDRETFDCMWELSAPDGGAEGCFLRIPQTEYYHDAVPPGPHRLQHMPNFRRLDAEQLVPQTVAGVAFDTLTIDVPVYLNYLLARFAARGGTIVRGSVQHIAQIAEGGVGAFTGVKSSAPVDAVVVCAGIGARALGGVEDKDVYPIRGQTVLVRAPWVRFGRTISSKEGLWTYIIPRRSGDVIVGGTKVDDDWYPIPRKETTLDILRRGFALCPELAPPGVRAEREPTVEDIIIIEEGCGLRPGRKGGVRLEVEWLSVTSGSYKVPIVHNYGHGGYGYQSSWGTALAALELLEGALAAV